MGGALLLFTIAGRNRSGAEFRLIRPIWAEPVFARIGQDRGYGVGVTEGQCVHSGVKECPKPT
jgi:hypothetical protein